MPENIALITAMATLAGAMSGGIVALVGYLNQRKIADDGIRAQREIAAQAAAVQRETVAVSLHLTAIRQEVAKQKLIVILDLVKLGLELEHAVLENRAKYLTTQDQAYFKVILDKMQEFRTRLRQTELLFSRTVSRAFQKYDKDVMSPTLTTDMSGALKVFEDWTNAWGVLLPVLRADLYVSNEEPMSPPAASPETKT